MRIPLLAAILSALPLAAACQQRYDHVSHPIPYSAEEYADDNDPDKAKAAPEAYLSPAITSPLAFTLAGNDGKPYPLSQHKGQVVLIVNTASKCGYTPQYAGLEAVYEKYKAQGFTIIAVPADNFNHQEPGDDFAIRSFCTKKYKVSFPLMAKVSVAGDDICPLYQFLTSKTPYATDREALLAFKGPIPWNFTKFLVDRSGKVVARFQPAQDPREKEVTGAIEKCLAEKAK